MARRTRPILIWVSVAVACAALGAWLTDVPRTIRCAAGPQLGMAECPPTNDELAALAVATRDAAGKSLQTLAAEEGQAAARLDTAATALAKATDRHETAEKAVRTAAGRLEDAERRLFLLSTCDPAAPTGREALSAAFEAAKADLARVRAQIVAARRRMGCVRFHGEIETRSRQPKSTSLHSRDARFRRVVEAETEQRRAFCREVAALASYSLEDPASRVGNIAAEKKRIASLQREDAALRVKVTEARAALSRREAAAATAAECSEIGATLTEAEARSDVALHQTSLTGLQSILKDRATSLTVARLQVDEAKALRADIVKKRTLACRDIARAVKDLETLDQSDDAARARQIQAEHCPD